ncbi:hypothetical protein CYLTODRAFT_423192 [Cylindrobasidium torrendii FP15055 ss-10]|uniref:Uncharacterized protein n=1 Tax=Cylindrobasidium torrendii FP15055 ss-10 TaxID=1314674 RepID=A0A0D7B8B5_9AGAR|nr:hypothetical protein CYLTODRAFT_423192 [Cylindrobasidium torrendii FP15055 ss-10]
MALMLPGSRFSIYKAMRGVVLLSVYARPCLYRNPGPSHALPIPSNSNTATSAKWHLFGRLARAKPRASFPFSVNHYEEQGLVSAA